MSDEKFAVIQKHWRKQWHVPPAMAQTVTQAVGLLQLKWVTNLPQTMTKITTYPQSHPHIQVIATPLPGYLPHAVYLHMCTPRWSVPASLTVTQTVAPPSSLPLIQMTAVPLLAYLHTVTEIAVHLVSLPAQTEMPAISPSLPHSAIETTMEMVRLLLQSVKRMTDQPTIPVFSVVAQTVI